MMPRKMTTVVHWIQSTDDLRGIYAIEQTLRDAVASMARAPDLISTRPFVRERAQREQEHQEDRQAVAESHSDPRRRRAGGCRWVGVTAVPLLG